MRDIGERIGITEGRVSQILKVCMDRIGKIHTKQDLSDLLAA
jgi:DNA-directed RNA polymerase specialized sigma subunit